MAPATKPKDKPKQSPSPTPSPAVAIEDLFSSLHRHIQNSEFVQAIKVSDQILAVAPGDEDALRCKVAALIKSDDIDRALSTIRECEKLQLDLNFYKVYCLYRQNRLDEALDCLKSEERSSNVLQLESQILYRLGKMDACADSYDKLRKLKIDPADLCINTVASLVSVGRASEVPHAMDTLKIKATSRFEMAYNVACSLIEQKKYIEAEKLLLAAKRIGQEALMEEDCTEEDIESDLAPITVQLAHVQQLLGRSDEAMVSYLDILKRNLADPSSLAVATNNLIALKGSKDLSDGLKKLDRFIERKDGTGQFQLTSGLDAKLFPRQKEAIYVNRLLLLLHANKLDQARELAASLAQMFAESMLPVLLEAAVLVRENKAGKAEELLEQFAGKFPDKAKTILLARAQIAAAAGHHAVASESLSRVPDIQHLPATVATMVTLKERVGDHDGASRCLDSAIEWWNNSMVGESKIDVIMHEAALFKCKHGKEEEAARLFEHLVMSSPNVNALVGLVTTMAHVNLAQAESYEKRLPSLSGLKGIDIESLEKTPGAGQVKLADVNMASAEDEKKSKARKKRKRKPRYPKGFDPNNPGPPPDPERWLPKRERSTYRPKRRDKRAQVRGAQGAVSKEKHETANSNSHPVASSSKAGPSNSGTNSSSKAGSSEAGSSKAGPANTSKSKSSRKKHRN